MHQLATLKSKQPTIVIEVRMICLNPSNESPIKSPSVDSTKEVVELLDHNLSTLNINKTWAYESKRKFQVFWVAKLPWVELHVGSYGFMHIV
jgi:hypothetical protein